jgi:hypothetical protein
MEVATTSDMRPCLWCNRDFLSASDGNRKCPSCKKKKTAKWVDQSLSVSPDYVESAFTQDPEMSA